jgi:hypothetical protein
MLNIINGVTSFQFYACIHLVSVWHFWWLSVFRALQSAPQCITVLCNGQSRIQNLYFMESETVLTRWELHAAGLVAVSEISYIQLCRTIHSFPFHAPPRALS